jgi:hypothetical protein
MAGPHNVHTKNNEMFTLYQKFGSESNIQFSQEQLKPDTNSKPAEPTEDPVMKGLPPPPPK